MKTPLSCDCPSLGWCSLDTLRVILTICLLVALSFGFAYVAVPGEARAADTCSGVGVHDPGTDPEVLVLTTATRLPQLCNRSAVEIQNLGPNPIYCALGYSSMARVGKARKIGAGEAWAVDAPHTLPIWCIAATASQVSGAATIVSEIK